jgi:hypothetical protein
MDRKPKKSEAKLDKDPYSRRSEKITDKAFKSVEKSVKPVAKDTNKTRRAPSRKRLVGDTVPNVKPTSNLKKVLQKAIKVKCC